MLYVVGIEHGYDKLKPEPIILYGRVNRGYASAEGLRIYGFDVHVSVESDADESADTDITNISL